MAWSAPAFFLMSLRAWLGILEGSLDHKQKVLIDIDLYGLKEFYYNDNKLNQLSNVGV